MKIISLAMAILMMGLSCPDSNGIDSKTKPVIPLTPLENAQILCNAVRIDLRYAETPQSGFGRQFRDICTLDRSILEVSQLQKQLSCSEKTLSFQALLAMVNSRGFSADNMHQCLKEAAGLKSKLSEKGQGAAVVGEAVKLAARAPCSAIFSPSLSAGSECQLPTDCKGALVCAFEDATYKKKICKDATLEGSACDEGQLVNICSTGTNCEGKGKFACVKELRGGVPIADGLSCKATNICNNPCMTCTGDVGKLKCSPFGAEGSSCQGATACRGDLFCAGFNCAKRLLAGADCTFSRECTEGLWCRGTTTDVQGTCSSLIANDAKCNSLDGFEQWQCTIGPCVNNQCSTGALGAACEKDRHCLSRDLFCSVGKCAERSYDSSKPALVPNAYKPAQLVNAMISGTLR